MAADTDTALNPWPSIVSVSEYNLAVNLLTFTDYCEGRGTFSTFPNTMYHLMTQICTIDLDPNSTSIVGHMTQALWSGLALPSTSAWSGLTIDVVNKRQIIKANYSTINLNAEYSMTHRDALFKACITYLVATAQRLGAVRGMCRQLLASLAAAAQLVSWIKRGQEAQLSYLTSYGSRMQLCLDVLFIHQLFRGGIVLAPLNVEDRTHSIGSQAMSWLANAVRVAKPASSAGSNAAGSSSGGVSGAGRKRGIDISTSSSSHKQIKTEHLFTPWVLRTDNGSYSNWESLRSNDAPFCLFHGVLGHTTSQCKHLKTHKDKDLLLAIKTPNKDQSAKTANNGAASPLEVRVQG